MRVLFGLWLGLLLGTAPATAAELELPRIFSNSMVLQRDVPVRIWGYAAPGKEVRVSIGNDRQSVRADDDGRFEATFAARSASDQPTRVSVATPVKTIQLDDVLFGDVWFCSGQSNMHWPIRASSRSEEFIASADEPRIRMFIAPQSATHEPARDCSGQWFVASPDTVARFSAVAYHFARSIIAEIDVPIGLVHASWGGSSAEAWVSRETLESLPEAQPFLERYDELYSVAAIDAKEFTSDNVDTSSWLKIQAPGTIESQGHDVDGMMWFRREIQIPRSWAGRALSLHLGPIDDNDVTYFNGVRIGATNNWQAPREYTVPADAVRAGKAVIAVRVEDTGGGGGFHGDPATMRIAPAVESGKPLSLAGEWRMRLLTERKAMPAQHRPANLYNGMVWPLRELAIRGVIWYQGENNAIQPRGDAYRTLFGAVIEDWRRAFTVSEDLKTLEGSEAGLPFYFVQLPNFTNNEKHTVWRYPMVRQAQLETMRAIPGTGMAVTLDLGEADDIHPRNKHDVGARLARWALADLYEKPDVVRSGPIFARAEFRGSAVHAHFDLYGSELTRRKGTKSLATFEAAGADGVFHPAKASIRGESVVITCSKVRSPRAVRYAWLNNAEDANLENALGLPASPFVARRD